MAISEKLSAQVLKEQNKVSDAAGFKPMQFETVLPVDTYNGTCTGMFKELQFTTKRGIKGRMNFAVCTVEIASTGKTIEVDIPISDTEIDSCLTGSPVEFKVFHPDNDDTLPKRVKLITVEAVVNP
jgi:hypothetical protein